MKEQKDKPIFDKSRAGERMGRQEKPADHQGKRTGMLKAAGLYEKRTIKGETYLSGRLGFLRVLVFRNRDRAKDADPTHFLCFDASDPPPRDPKE